MSSSPHVGKNKDALNTHITFLILDEEEGLGIGCSFKKKTRASELRFFNPIQKQNLKAIISHQLQHYR